MVSILFPGRHHMLTKFQEHYLKSAVEKGIDGRKVDQIIFAVTSANHNNTRRNPIPLYLRAMAIEDFAKNLGCDVKIYPIPDIEQTEKFAKYILSQIFYQSGEKITPNNTILAASTPNVIAQFKKLGFGNLPVELADERKGKYSALRPYEVIDLLVEEGAGWRNGKRWRGLASEASQMIYERYGLGDLITELFSDSLLSEDADITGTRDYNTYAAGMDKNVGFKFNDISPFVIEGKIVDAGCGTGALVNLLAGRFKESDIIGIEATRKFYEHCRMQDYHDSFVFFYRKNILDQNFRENSINTFIYSSILHEIYSYISEAMLKKVIRNTFSQLAHGGRIIIRDVVGPEHGKRRVLLELNRKDGKSEGKIEELSTHAKFFRFAQDFKRGIKFKEKVVEGRDLIEISLKDAYEFLSKMSYTDNWESEMHEEFGFYSFSKWKDVLESEGFSIVEGSKAYQSDYIIEHMYKDRAKIYSFVGNRLVLEDYPPTNMILVGEKRR